MQVNVVRPSRYGLEQHGIREWGVAHWNLGVARLVETALLRGEGQLANNGALVVRTGKFTGRSPRDKYVVRDQATESTVHWGAVNQSMGPDQFGRLLGRMLNFWKGRELFVQDLRTGADPAYGIRVRVITSLAWHSLFGRQLFLRLAPETLEDFAPDFTLMFAPQLEADPVEHGTNSTTCIAIDFSRRLVLIAGTSYAGEMKKSVFTIMNYLLPEQGVFPMHCSGSK